LQPAKLVKKQQLNIQVDKWHLTHCVQYQEQIRKDVPGYRETSDNTNSHRRQSKLVVPTIDATLAKELDHQAAMAFYLSASPFGLFHQPGMERFLKSLNPAYKLPEYRRFSGALLDAAYLRVKAQVDHHLQQATHLNIIMDERSNITMERIANLSVHTQNGAFYYASDNITAKRLTAAITKELLINKLLELTENNLLRINSIATDTCPTMFAVWDLLTMEKSLKHVLFVPYDAHGLQLVIKDLLDSSMLLKTTHFQAQSIANAFRSAPLQYARLREYQQIKYNKHYALILAVITRWGTQYRLIQFILRSKDALRAYAFKPTRLPTDLRGNAIATIKDPSFWSNLDVLNDVIQPIDDRVQMAESTKSHIGTVME
jgi:hypothetical protein